MLWCFQELDKRKGNQTYAFGHRIDTVRPLPHLIAGAVSAAVTRTVVAPLERVKMDQLLLVASQ